MGHIRKVYKIGEKEKECDKITQGMIWRECDFGETELQLLFKRNGLL